MGYKSKYSGKEVEERLDSINPIPSNFWDLIDEGNVLEIKKILDPIREMSLLGTIDTGVLCVSVWGDNFDEVIWYRMSVNPGKIYVTIFRATINYITGTINVEDDNDYVLFNFNE